MHDNAARLFRKFAAKYVKDGDLVLDVGSLNVNGCHKDILKEMPFIVEYLGIDIREGPNVHQVVLPYSYPFVTGSFDVVVSGQCIEHSPRPWAIVHEISRCVKSGGYVFISAPWSWQIHRHPLDCFRILPDGMRAMMEDAGLTVLECEISGDDTYAIGTK